MKHIGLLTLLLLMGAQLMAQHKQLVVFPFRAVPPLSAREAAYVANYTIVQIENLNKFDVIREDTIPALLGKGNLGISGVIKDSSGKAYTEAVHSYVIGVVQRNTESYSVDLSVGDDESGDVSTDHFELPFRGDGSQRTLTQQFLLESSGLSDLIQPHGFFKTFFKEPDYQKFGAGLSISYASNPYYGEYIINHLQPISMMLDISLSSNVFLILGGSYVMQNGERNSQSSLNSGSIVLPESLLGTHDYYTAKAGAGIRFWKVRLFSTYDRNIAKDIDKDLQNNELLPSWNLTVGIQWYLSGKFYLGTEMYIYKPVDYTSRDGQTLVPANGGTNYFPAICIGFN